MLKLRLACWNIGSLLGDLMANAPQVEAALEKIQPDVICLQEFPDVPAFLQRLKQNAGYEHHLFCKTSESHVGENVDMGICILSKYPLGEGKILHLDKPVERIFYEGREEFWHDKYFLMAQVNCAEKEFYIVTGHSFPFYRYGLKDSEHGFVFRQIDGWLAQHLQGKEYIIAADFNSADPLPFMPFVQADHYDVFAGLPTRPSGRKTDILAIHRDMQLLESINTPWNTDHHLIGAQILME